jgi:hypothetical protein
VFLFGRTTGLGKFTKFANLPFLPIALLQSIAIEKTQFWRASNFGQLQFFLNIPQLLKAQAQVAKRKRESIIFFIPINFIDKI